jgi:hypothetical protein
MPQTWSQEQKQRILDEYRRTRMVYCPLDQMPIDIKDPEPGDDPRIVIFACPTCGNAFKSSEVS